MRALNDALMERKVDAQYATLSLATWNARDRDFTISGAGTLPPLLCRKGDVMDVKTEGVPIGLLQDQNYEQLKFPVLPNDLLLFYSDGVEDQLADKDEFGRDRVAKLMRKIQTRSPDQIVKSIFAALDEFRGPTPLTDDQTAIALRVT